MTKEPLGARSGSRAVPSGSDKCRVKKTFLVFLIFAFFMRLLILLLILRILVIVVNRRSAEEVDVVSSAHYFPVVHAQLLHFFIKVLRNTRLIKVVRNCASINSLVDKFAHLSRVVYLYVMLIRNPFFIFRAFL